MEDYIENAIEAFKEMINSLEPIVKNLSFDFSDIQHDRLITLNNSWKIILGRGLDSWHKNNSCFDIPVYI